MQRKDFTPAQEQKIGVELEDYLKKRNLLRQLQAAGSLDNIEDPIFYRRLVNAIYEFSLQHDLFEKPILENPVEIELKATEIELLDPPFLLKLGLMYKRSGKEHFLSSFKSLNKAAELGFAPAQYELGIFCLCNLCPALFKSYSDAYKKSIYWFTKAAEQGVSAAHYKLGEAYFWGLNIKRDINVAFEHWRKAAEINDSYDPHLDRPNQKALEEILNNWRSSIIGRHRVLFNIGVIMATKDLEKNHTEIKELFSRLAYDHSAQFILWLKKENHETQSATLEFLDPVARDRITHLLWPPAEIQKIKTAIFLAMGKDIVPWPLMDIIYNYTKPQEFSEREIKDFLNKMRVIFEVEYKTHAKSTALPVLQRGFYEEISRKMDNIKHNFDESKSEVPQDTYIQTLNKLVFTIDLLVNQVKTQFPAKKILLWQLTSKPVFMASCDRVLAVIPSGLLNDIRKVNCSSQFKLS